MTIEVQEPGAPLTDEHLAELEKQIGASLPGEYRRFLLEHNGGLPSPDVVEVEGAPESPTDIQVFFGIGRPVESSDLTWNKRTFSDRIPDELLPVACDSGGNLFCLVLSGEDAGKVIYVDLESAKPEQYVVADHFDAFLEQIRA